MQDDDKIQILTKNGVVKGANRKKNKSNFGNIGTQGLTP